MKNKILVSLLIIFQIFLTNKIFSEEIEFNASEIEIFNEQGLTIANNANAIIKNDGITIEGLKIKYFKEKSLLLVNEAKIRKLNDNLEINANEVEYQINESKLFLKNTIDVYDKKNDISIASNQISYDIKNRLISSQSNSKISDNLGNNYQVKGFEYSLEKKIIKLTNLQVLDEAKNTLKLDLAFLDLNKKELVAKDVNLDFKISQNSENEPRLKGRSLITNENKTIVEKGTFTFCKKREKCPPWEMSADKITHDKKKKVISYKNASLKLYDKKVFYFPKFFHPDPTVERQTGFLIPKIQDNSTTGMSLNLPYFMALAKNKDITLSPRFFADDKFLIQSEFRKKNKNSNYIFDLSQYSSKNENSNGHFFYNYQKDYIDKKSNNVEFNIRLEQVSDETYLKTFKIESPIIKNNSILKNSISLDYNNQNRSINTSFDIYEDLAKLDNDKYEYVPNFNFSKVINENFLFNANGYYKHYNTNISEKILINKFEFNTDPIFFNNGFINDKKILLKNVNSDAKNSKNYKNKSSSNLTPTIQTNYSLPLKKETNNFDKILTPKFSLKLSLPHTKNVKTKDRQINYDNIYNLDRLGIEDLNEGGISAIYGYEYTKINRNTLNEQIRFGIANNLRFEENKKLPNNSNLGDKVSDFVGLFQYKPNDNFIFDYDFSLKNNLVEKNYELFGFEFYLNNFTSKIEYINENNSNSKTSYLQNETRYNFNENNSLAFKTRENKEKSFTEFYNLIYQYQNDCLKAGIEYNKEYYNDQDLKPSENLFLKISILPFGGFNSPNLK